MPPAEASSASSSAPPSAASSTAADNGAVLAALWHHLGGSPGVLQHCRLEGDGPIVPSSFAVATAAQASLAAAALATLEIDGLRNPRTERQTVTIERRHAVAETMAWFALDGRVPDLWDPLSGLYPCGANGGWVRIHANFAHHRDGALRLLGLDPVAPGPAVTREQVGAALRTWSAERFEQAAADAGLAVAALRPFEAWDAHPQSACIRAAPLVRVERRGDAPPRPWPARDPDAAPLHGLRVLELTRILAGPVAGRTLAAYGADVLLVNGPHLPNIESIAETSRGKRSALVDLREAAGRDTLDRLVHGADVFLQSYRPGALAARGFGADDLVRRAPGLVVVSLSAYGAAGPWGGRRGFDSLVQTATGLNRAEAEAFGSTTPRPLPMQILDHAAGFLLAAGAQRALVRQRTEGGSWLVEVTLAGVAQWLRSLGRVSDGPACPKPALDELLAPFVDESDSGFGRLRAVRPAARFSRPPPAPARPSMPPGTHAPHWNGTPVG